MSDAATAILELAPLMTQAQISRKLNVSEGYVSQVINQSDLSNKVIQAKLKYLDEATERDNTLNKIEDLIVNKLKEAIPNFYKPKDILMAFSVVNKAVRRGATTEDLQSLNRDSDNKVIQINLPEVIRQRYKLNSQSEVIEVEGRPLVTADSKTLYQQVTQEEEKQNVSPDSKISASPKRESASSKLLRLAGAEIDLDNPNDSSGTSSSFDSFAEKVGFDEN